MRTESRVFGLLAVLLIGGSVGYGFWTAGSLHHVEYAGVTALGLSGVLCGMSGVYFWLVSRRIPLRPEDRPDADVADGAGPVGFFAPAGFWQVGVALSMGTGAVAIAVGQFWLLAVGVLALLATAAGLVFEFYAGAPRSE